MPRLRRRDFLKTTALTGTAASDLAIYDCVAADTCPKR